MPKPIFTDWERSKALRLRMKLSIEDVSRHFPNHTKEQVRAMCCKEAKKRNVSLPVIDHGNQRLSPEEKKQIVIKWRETKRADRKFTYQKMADQVGISEKMVQRLVQEDAETGW